MKRLVREHELPMKVTAIDYVDRDATGGSTFVVYFTAPHRVDFRALVRDLGRVLGARVELRQLSARDDAKVQGGIGPCGRDLCCATFLRDFEPVSVRMAKDQDLGVNPMRISGACGRLMCCLKYEHPLYQEFKATAPAIGATVETPEGDGRVVGHQVPTDSVVVRMAALRPGLLVQPGQRVLATQGVRDARRRRAGREPASAGAPGSSATSDATSTRRARLDVRHACDAATRGDGRRRSLLGAHARRVHDLGGRPRVAATGRAPSPSDAPAGPPTLPARRGARPVLRPGARLDPTAATAVSSARRSLVPLDYADPDGDTVEIAVNRLPATGRATGSARSWSTRAGRAASGLDYARSPDVVTAQVLRGVRPRRLRPARRRVELDRSTASTTPSSTSSWRSTHRRTTRRRRRRWTTSAAAFAAGCEERSGDDAAAHGHRRRRARSRRAPGGAR